MERREWDGSEKPADESWVGVCGVESVLTEVNREQGGRERAVPCSRQEFVLDRC